MDPRDEIESEQINALTSVFRDQLVALLEECARGRPGLFGQTQSFEDESGESWREAAQLRELAIALQAILAQSGERSALCDEFLDLCTMHGEHHPGEPRLARSFLARIEKSEVGTPTEPEWKPR